MERSFDGGRSCSDAVVSHSAAASELFLYFFQKNFTKSFLSSSSSQIHNQFSHKAQIYTFIFKNNFQNRDEQHQPNKNGYLGFRSEKIRRNETENFDLLCYALNPFLSLLNSIQIYRFRTVCLQMVLLLYGSENEIVKVVVSMIPILMCCDEKSKIMMMMLL